MEKFGYFDCHADTLTEIPEGTGETLISNKRDVDLSRVDAFSDEYTQIFAIWEDMHKVEPGTETENFRRLYRRATDLLSESASRIGLCTDAAGMERLHREGKAAAFLSIEDLAVAGDDAEHIYDLGIRFVLLTWNYTNRYGSGAVASQEGRLTDRGREMVRDLTDQGIILDVSHLSDAGVEDVLTLTDRPIMASHSDIRSVCGKPRNLTDTHMKEIIKRGGLIGINLFAPFVGDHPDMNDVLRHMDAVLEAGGEHTLAFGADFDGSDGLFPEGIRGVQSMPDLRSSMKENGFDGDLLDRIFYRNGEEFIRRNLTA